MRKLQLAKIIIVALALLTPALSLLVFGLGEGFENRTRTEIPPVAELLKPDPAARASFAKALFETATVKQEAINVVSKAQLQLAEQIETPTVVSGEDGWLFFKPGLNLWHCSAHPGLKSRLDRVAFLFDLVSAAELPLVFAIAPNKASIERDKFGGRAEAYKQCYDVILSRFESISSAADSAHVVDHSAPMRAIVAAGRPAYLMWDTHWTEAAGFDAMNQLFEARPGEIGIPQRAVATERIPQQADLAAMLALDASHLPAIEAPQPEPIREAQQMPVAPLFLHDSFYERIMPYLVSRAPSASFERMQQYRLQTARETLDAASLVVFSAVQRNYPRYVWSREVLGWGGAIGDWILAGMNRASQSCQWGDTVKVVARRDPRSPGGLLFSIPRVFQSGAFCLRVRTSLPRPVRAMLQVSSSEWGMPEFSTGRMIETHFAQGNDVLGLIVPAGYGAEQYRLSLTGRLSASSRIDIEVAHLP
ncbi:hypothetical protein A3709_15240 [Halioglobus sp. HI00S01]|uniref:alginate O-acetyltransferase AlgX-related protein n=1 Tax=Halioglobus sp. HI00S01 TaxID=1822214 RepID=UPI0007C37D1B|nr:hypothetical protein [Halioglobus sp. HI00S01]KZX59262.1 hypothetical protein A3709_15240 [Halioglobus sp. HI00S01]